MKRTQPVFSCPWLFATDLDGTLLDEDTYGFEPALPALTALRQTNAPLILASSKTRREMEALALTLGTPGPLIVENGAAFLMPRARGGYELTVLGQPARDLARQLRELAAESGASVRGFSTLTAAELSQLAGLSLPSARRALTRSWGEPFLLEDERALAGLVSAAAQRGLRVTRGGRFFHLGGDCDKGQALRAVLTALPRAEPPRLTVALGDAANDVPLLQAVDRPILMPRRGGQVDPALAAALPGAECAPQPGPAGWNTAVLTVLAGGQLRRVSPMMTEEVP